jgi:hypothetical protein
MMSCTLATTRSIAPPAALRARPAAALTAIPAAWTFPPGDRRTIRRPGQRLGRADRHEGAGPARGRHLGRLERDGAIAAGPVGGGEAVMHVLHRRLRVKGQHGVLGSSAPILA